MTLREKLHEIIFEAETPTGRTFDIALLWTIVASVVCVVLESVASLRELWGYVFFQLEVVFTLLFTVEFFLRLYCVKKPSQYVFSFYGLVDLLSILPFYLSFIFTGGQSLMIIRGLRLLRIFRLLKLGRYVGEAAVITDALRSSRYKITVFLMAVFTVVLIVGTAMYLIEGEENGFTSIPRSVYWAIVTITTVGYGDIAPKTVLGQMLASVMMVLGYGIIAVPTGIVTAELNQQGQNRRRPPVNTICCPHCTNEGHAQDAKFCRHCGGQLHD